MARLYVVERSFFPVESDIRINAKFLAQFRIEQVGAYNKRFKLRSLFYPFPGKGKVFSGKESLRIGIDDCLILQLESSNLQGLIKGGNRKGFVILIISQFYIALNGLKSNNSSKKIGF